MNLPTAIQQNYETLSSFAADPPASRYQLAIFAQPNEIPIQKTVTTSLSNRIKQPYLQ